MSLPTLMTLPQVILKCQPPICLDYRARNRPQLPQVCFPGGLYFSNLQLTIPLAHEHVCISVLKEIMKKKHLEHQTLGQCDNCPIDLGTQCIILKIVGFLQFGSRACMHFRLGRLFLSFFFFFSLFLSCCNSEKLLHIALFVELWISLCKFGIVYIFSSSFQ